MSVDQIRRSADQIAWFKSSYSAGDGGDCVEVATSLHTVQVRDSKETERPGLAVAPDAWAAFVGFAAGRNG
ncbi:DUF397 domain-containing protein [Streptomyces sp. GC420]|uniref:DUF397 domain-containing protein n=1 Tax=Streptomyces sp. GC420 TaxID=2697568 RepID=UPI001414EF77|nr:DUF397 domain-containing protein [Streptomyces sp. GC420]NBM17553.1 DUF397 domain-containing protein [Streptomyces sp. GC420]